MKRHVILVGLPGVGKSTVGMLSAEELGAPFVDLDAVITRRGQMPVARIFAELGEGRFRELETEAMTSVLEGEPSIISPGGGWIAQPGNFEAARPTSFFVWLTCMVNTAANRAEEGERRPLLSVQPLDAMRRLLSERERYYKQADAEIRNESRAPRETAKEVVAVLRERAGW